MRITVVKVISRVTNKEIGVEITVDDECFFKLKDQSGPLKGLRVGRIIARLDEKLSRGFYFNQEV